MNKNVNMTNLERWELLKHWGRTDNETQLIHMRWGTCDETSCEWKHLQTETVSCENDLVVIPSQAVMETQLLLCEEDRNVRKPLSL